MSAAGKCVLSGGLVLSTGKDVRVRVELDCPALAPEEEREVESARIALHDLTPIQLPEESGPVRVDYDDDQLDVVDKINAALRCHGLAFVDDGLTHDGYCIFTLRTRKEGSS